MGTIKRTFANSLTGTGKLSATNLDSNIPAANIADASVTNVTTLPESLGQAIKSVAGNPPSQALGDIWYDTNIGKLKNYALLPATWSAGGNLSNARDRMGGAGTQTAGVVFGGFNGTLSPVTRTATEEYDGSAYSSGGALPQAKFALTPAPAGTQTAALGFAGRFTPAPYPSPNTYFNTTEEYDGSTWTSGGTYPISTIAGSGAGTQTAALGFGQGIPDYGTTSAEYDGSTWTAVNPINTARYYTAGFGIQTAALMSGGAPNVGPSITATEEYDGTSWVSVNSNLTARYSSNGNGTQTDGVVYGGLRSSPPSAFADDTELYDGTSWTTTTPMTTGRRYIAGFNSSGSSGGVAAGGTTTGSVATTEEFTGQQGGIKTVTTS